MVDNGASPATPALPVETVAAEVPIPTGNFTPEQKIAEAKLLNSFAQEITRFTGDKELMQWYKKGLTPMRSKMRPESFASLTGMVNEKMLKLRTQGKK